MSPFIEAFDLAVVRYESLLGVVMASTPKGDVQVWAPSMLLYMGALALGVLWAGLRIFRGASAKFAEMA